MVLRQRLGWVELTVRHYSLSIFSIARFVVLHGRDRGKLMDPVLLQNHITHFASFRSLQSLAFFLVDLSAFDHISITTCFRHFETVQSLLFCNVVSPVTNILLLTSLLRNPARVPLENHEPLLPADPLTPPPV
jgi:hypothetical protein